MIDLYYWRTPNGHKITMFLEEAGLEYRIHATDITTGQQFEPAFLAISPNNKMPAIADRSPGDRGEAIAVFESGAILQSLAEKTGLFLPQEQRRRKEVIEWLFWQVGGLGPMARTITSAPMRPRRFPMRSTRYVNETNRLYGVLDRRHGYLSVDRAVATPKA